MRRRARGGFEVTKSGMAAVFALLFTAALAAKAGEPAPPAKAETPQARAFLGLAESDRKAAQEALGWLGFYNGADDGVPAKRTIDALKAYQQSVAAAPDGVMTAKLLSALTAGAAKAKAAVGFATIDDAATGVRIGAPMKVLVKRAAGVFSNKDATVQLRLLTAKGDLGELYQSLTAADPRTKLTYKAMKPGAFLVTAGETGDAKVYTRYAADGDSLRGFSFSYPKARAKALDPVALAIANSFGPLPAAPLPPIAPPKPAPPRLVATALIVAPGVAVTALDPSRCENPDIAGKPARFLAPSGALARLGGDFGVSATAPEIGAGGGDLVVLSISEAGLEATPVRGLGPAEIVAGLSPAASGAPLFDRKGRLVALVSAIATAPSRAGVALAAPHATLSAAALGEPSNGAGADLTAAEIAKLRRAAVVGVFCGA